MRMTQEGNLENLLTSFNFLLECRGYNFRYQLNTWLVGKRREYQLVNDASMELSKVQRVAEIYSTVYALYRLVDQIEIDKQHKEWEIEMARRKELEKEKGE